MPIFGVVCIYTCILLVAQTEMKVLTDETPIQYLYTFIF
jgi:hypothetical protein